MRSSINILLLALALVDTICLITRFVLMFTFPLHNHDEGLLKYLDLSFQLEVSSAIFIFSAINFGNTFGNLPMVVFIRAFCGNHDFQWL
jgi:hypothetical protein